MIGSVKEIDSSILIIKTEINLLNIQNLMNNFVYVQDKDQYFIGQIINLTLGDIKVKLIGEYKEGKFIYGNVKKPSLGSKTYLMSNEFVKTILGYYKDDTSSMFLGKSPIYSNIEIGLNINTFFSNHFAIFGTTGMGKSCCFTKLMENLFLSGKPPLNSHFFVFDAYGEYHNTFLNIASKNGICFRYISTDINSKSDKLQIPLWLIDADDIALLLGVDNPANLPVIEKALKLSYIFTQKNTEVTKYKNHIIAKALIDMLLSGRPAGQIRDQFIGCLSKYNTESLNVDSKVIQPGYTRTIRQCLLIDENNKIRAIELLVDFLRAYLIDDFELPLLDGSVKFSLKDLIYAFDFALIDEGMWNNTKLFELTNSLRVRLNSLYNSDYNAFFEIDDYFDMKTFINKLTRNKINANTQIINFNISYVDDRFAKTVVKIYSKMLFNYAKNNENRLSFPVNIVLEESHRYVQNDNDVNIIGYNIFDRIVKEGRKYGVSLGLISQRPSELSETTLSQCSNFILFKMNHPKDIAFVSEMIPNITDDIIDTIKDLQPGVSVIFGNAFKLTSLVKFDMPSVPPESSGSDLMKEWY